MLFMLICKAYRQCIITYKINKEQLKFTGALGYKIPSTLGAIFSLFFRLIAAGQQPLLPAAYEKFDESKTAMFIFEVNISFTNYFL